MSDNQNKKFRNLARLTIAAGAMIAGSSLTANAVPLAGASSLAASSIASTVSSEKSSTTETNHVKSASTRAGVSSMLAKITTAS